MSKRTKTVVEPSDAVLRAQAIKAHLAKDPDQHDVEAVAAATKIDVDHVRPILDAWRPDDSEDGVTFVGPGQGGPWLPGADPDGFIELETEK